MKMHGYASTSRLSLLRILLGLEKYIIIGLVQVRLSTEVPRTPSSARSGLERK